MPNGFSFSFPFLSFPFIFAPRHRHMAEDGRLIKQEEDYTAQVDEALPVALALASVLASLPPHPLTD
jgi:hypothetical protein